MCGIAGFCINKNDHLPRLSSIVDELLLQIEARGQDSTGMAYVTPDRKAFLHKDAVPASKYVKGKRPRGVNNAMLGVLHTRYATKGTVLNRANNHPIIHGDVIGVHNGHLSNDDDIFDMLPTRRIGQVDSEAAFALLNHEDDTLKALSMLRGNAALAWFDRREKGGTLHLARVSSSPLSVGQTKRGSLFFASTMRMLESAMFIAGVELDWSMELGEGTYLKVRNGRIESMESFTPAPPLYVGSMAFNTRRTVVDGPSRWFDWDGTWLDDDTFIPID